MYILNITFIVEKADVKAQLAYIRDVFIPAVRTPAVRGIRLMHVAYVAGQPDFAEQASSYPLHIEFDSAEARTDFIEHTLDAAFESYFKVFGPKGGVMMSMLDDEPLTSDN